ncbi:hypothetical protein OIU76_021572 [Salix suchowensis]|nr:hypothetical protein OIU76_021572 [Salix suchowensis]
MYAAMAQQFAEYKNVAGLKNDPKNPFDKGRSLGLEAGETKILLDFFTKMQNINSNFFYAVDLGEDQCLKNLFWADAKSRHDYSNFSDVVSFDTTYVRNKYKMPLALFVGVNQHYQFMLLGCALISDESAATYSWLMQTWLRAMGGQTPKVIITDQDKVVKQVISEVFPIAHHCFFLWNILGKVSENLGNLYVHKKTSVQEFVRQYEPILQDRYEEEAKADSDTWNKQPALKSPSPLEKSVSGMYTHAVFKKFQVEVLGVVACHPKMEFQDEISVNFRVQDLEKQQDFTVLWNQIRLEGKNLKRYNLGCKGDVFGNCISMNNSNKSLVEAVTSTTHGLLCIEDDNQNRSMTKTNKKKNQTKKRKVNSEQEITTVGPQDSLQQMEKLRMVQLNLMAPTRDNYYSNQQTIQGLGQLNSIAPSHDGYYSTQQSMHGLGQMDFFRAPTAFAYGIRDDPNVRTAPLHDDGSRHA